MAEIETEVKPEEPTEDDMDISDSDENQGKPPLPPMPPPDDDYNLQNSNQNEQYNEEMQSRVTDLSLLLFDKLEFLEVSKKGLTNFQVMFIELEVRQLFFLISSKFCLSMYTASFDHDTIVDCLEMFLEVNNITRSTEFAFHHSVASYMN